MGTPKPRWSGPVPKEYAMPFVETRLGLWCVRCGEVNPPIAFVPAAGNRDWGLHSCGKEARLRCHGNLPHCRVEGGSGYCVVHCCNIEGRP